MFILKANILRFVQFSDSLWQEIWASVSRWKALLFHIYWSYYCNDTLIWQIYSISCVIYLLLLKSHSNCLTNWNWGHSEFVHFPIRFSCMWALRYEIKWFTAQGVSLLGYFVNENDNIRLFIFMNYLTCHKFANIHFQLQVGQFFKKMNPMLSCNIHIGWIVVPWSPLGEHGRNDLICVLLFDNLWHKVNH